MTEGSADNKAHWEFGDFLLSLVIYRRMVLVTTLVAFIVATAVAFLVPVWYRSTAVLMPPQEEENGLASLASSFLGKFAGGGGGGLALPGMVTPSDLYAAMLHSRALQYPIITKYDYKHVYKNPYLTLAQKEFDGHLEIAVEPTGLVSIGFEDQDRIRAWSVLRDLLRGLDSINIELRTGSARQTRIFLEERSQSVLIDLHNAERKMSEFQSANHFYTVSDQARVLVEAAAQIEAQIQMALLQRDLLKTALGPGNSQVIQKEAEVSALQNRLKAMDSGPGSILGPSLEGLPDVAFEYIRLERSLKILELLYELITQQLETSRIQEKKDTPTLQILAQPDIAEIKWKPKRAQLIAGATIASFLFACLMALLLAWVGRLAETQPETHVKLVRFFDLIRNDFLFFRRKVQGY